MSTNEIDQQILAYRMERLKLISTEICAYFQVTHEEIKSKTRSEQVVKARHTLWYFLYEFGKLSSADIASEYKRNTSATIRMAIMNLRDMLKMKNWVYEDIEKLKPVIEHICAIQLKRSA